MPTFMYRAKTKNGQEVKNRVEDSSRISLIKKLKRNGLIPISVVQSNIGVSGQRTQKKKKRNMADAENILRKVNTSNTGSKRKRKYYFKREISIVDSTWRKNYTKRPNDFYSKLLLTKKSKF